MGKAYDVARPTPLDEIVVNDIRLATNGGFVLGRARFAEEIAGMLGRRVARGKPGRAAATKGARHSRDVSTRGLALVRGDRHKARRT